MPKAGKNKKKYMNLAPPPNRVGRSRGKVEGPGVWVTCVKGKEKQTIGELYDLFESLADELYPNEKDDAPDATKAVVDDDNDDDPDDAEDLEAALSRELKELKAPRQRSRFANARTDIVCAVFISIRPPIDPVRLVRAHFENLERTAVTHTRHALRFSPVSDSCPATLPDIIKMAERLLPEAFTAMSEPGIALKFRIQITSRNHSTVSRNELIPALAKCVPAPHVVDLERPDLTILVELYMFTCGLGVVRDYDRLKKFNCMSVADEARKGLPGGGPDERSAIPSRIAPSGTPIVDESPAVDG